jgi:NADH:ubiquinone oxidoreductase subunit E
MRCKNIKICKGPNCKAWSSDQIAKELREIGNTLNLRCIKVCRVHCMDACHGGVSVRIDSKRKVLKLNEEDNLLNILGIHEVVLY